MTDQIDNTLAAKADCLQLKANIDLALVEGNWPSNAEFAFTQGRNEGTEFFMSESDMDDRYEEYRLRALEQHRCYSFAVYRWDWGPEYVETRHIVV